MNLIASWGEYFHQFSWGLDKKCGFLTNGQFLNVSPFFDPDFRFNLHYSHHMSYDEIQFQHKMYCCYSNDSALNCIDWSTFLVAFQNNRRNCLGSSHHCNWIWPIGNSHFLLYSTLKYLINEYTRLDILAFFLKILNYFHHIFLIAMVEKWWRMLNHIEIDI